MQSKQIVVNILYQGPTDYLNCSLQTMYMTPEVRKALYEYRYDQERDGPADRCIPYQLQKLFANLQLSCRPVVKTTVSFGYSKVCSRDFKYESTF
jgi:ubiquitin carboxyl-terminal hydrolase 47